MWLRARITVAAALLCGMTVLCHAQDPANIAHYQEHGNLLLSRVRSALRDQSSAADRAVQDQIHASIPPVEYVNGVAYQKNGTRYIEISAGLVEVVDWVATAEAISVLTGNRDCETRYVNYLGDAITKNTGLHRDRFSLLPVLSPFGFYDRNGPSCPLVTVDDIKNNPRANLTRDLVINESFMQVYAHEVGHHIYNDPFSSAANWCEQQKREARADAYSFKVLTGPDQSPLVAIPVLLIFAEYEGFSADDRGRSHPAALKRVLAMMRATRAQIDNDSELQESLRKTGRAAEFYRYLDQYESLVKSEIAAAPKDECGSENFTKSSSSGGGKPAPFGDSSQPGRGSLAGNLRQLIATRGDFSSFKGQLDPDGDGTEWTSSFQLPGAMDCTVRINRGFNAGQSFQCQMARTSDPTEAASAYDQLQRSISAALPPGWRQEAAQESSSQRSIYFKKTNKDPWISLRVSGSRKISVYFTMFSPSDDD
jgi:hypothetical protein